MMRIFHKMNKVALFFTLFFSNFVCFAITYTISLYLLEPEYTAQQSPTQFIVSILVASFSTSSIGSVLMYLWFWIKSKKNMQS